eukprot:g16133.t1
MGSASSVEVRHRAFSKFHIQPAVVYIVYIKGPLPGLFLVLPARGDGTGLRAAGHLVRVRSGGFMVVLPDAVELSQYLREQVTSEGTEAYALYPTEVLLETPRGRSLGEGPCLLVDAVWEVANQFMRAHPLRSSATFELLRFMQGDQVCRPRRSSLVTQADHWIHEVMDDDTAGDYVTGLSEEELLPAGDYVGEGPSAEDLHRRVAELEAMLQQTATPTGTPARRTTAVTPPRPKGVLFEGVHQIGDGGTRQEALTRLRALAGAAPMKLGGHEQGPRFTQADQAREGLQQEQGLEAVEESELEEGLKELEAAVQDPMQRMMLLQMQQLALMTRQQRQLKPQDPISAALGGGGDSSSGGSTGIKGCMAREAFVRLMEDLPKFANAVMANAARELGLELATVGPGLMRDYIEKRCPLGENRALTQQAYLWAWAWETGFRTNNADLMGVACRGLVYIDQTAMDFNRTKLSWLLTALPEPQYSVCQKNRVPNTLSPFSRLANASWVGANVAFLKDLDFLEAKMKGMNTQPKNSNPDGGQEEAAAKRPWRPKKKKGGAAASTEDSAA